MRITPCMKRGSTNSAAIVLLIQVGKKVPPCSIVVGYIMLRSLLRPVLSTTPTTPHRLFPRTMSVLAPASKFKLALIQLLGSPDKAANLAKARDKVLEAAKNGANVVVLPVCKLSRCSFLPFVVANTTLCRNASTLPMVPTSFPNMQSLCHPALQLICSQV